MLLILNTTEEESVVYAKALAVWGIESQLLKLSEECGELVQAIAKLQLARLHDKDWAKELYALREELADVLIMIRQVSLWADSDCVQAVAVEKLGRVESWLEKAGA